MARATERRLRAAPLRRGGLTAVATVLGAAALLATAGDALAVDSLAVSASPGAQATVPMTIAAHGTTSEPSTLRVFVAPGAGCASDGAAASSAALQSQRAGSVEVISEQPSGSFAYSAQYTPPAAGGYATCAYLFRASATSSVSSQVSQGFAVGAAPSPPPPPAPGGEPGDGGGVAVAQTPHCVVPRLVGHTYEGARTLLHRAGCIVGKVAKPDVKKARPLKRGGRRRILEVKSQLTPAGTVLKTRAPVSLRLQYVTPTSRYR